MQTAGNRLDAMGRSRLQWHTDYSTMNLVAIKAAVKAGLGITVRPIEMMSPGVRMLGEKDGFPAIDDITYFLWMRRDVINPVTSHLFHTLKQQLDLQDANQP